MARNKAAEERVCGAEAGKKGRWRRVVVNMAKFKVDAGNIASEGLGGSALADPFS